VPAVEPDNARIAELERENREHGGMRMMLVAKRGRTSCRYCSTASAAHGITVATALRRGGLPHIALP
jgi:hypothetical protein